LNDLILRRPTGNITWHSFPFFSLHIFYEVQLLLLSKLLWEGKFSASVTRNSFQEETTMIFYLLIMSSSNYQRQWDKYFHLVNIYVAKKKSTQTLFICTVKIWLHRMQSIWLGHSMKLDLPEQAQQLLVEDLAPRSLGPPANDRKFYSNHSTKRQFCFQFAIRKQRTKSMTLFLQFWNCPVR